MKMPSNLGMLLLAIWLILHGLVFFLKLSFSGLPEISAALALVSGILLLLGR